jgi:hypothetical protein
MINDKSWNVRYLFFKILLTFTKVLVEGELSPQSKFDWKFSWKKWTFAGSLKDCNGKCNLGCAQCVVLIDSVKRL